jgi:threonine/homoserine/homoserine lactone efflux protein
MGLTVSTALAFAFTSLLIELTPGPNMTYLALVGLQAGRRAGYAATLGVALGFGLVGLAAALGLSTLIAGSPMTYAALRWVGVAYFVYLAWEAWRDSERSSNASVEPDRRFFLRGLITNLLNPKAAVFYISILPTFLDRGYPVTEQALALSAIYVLVASGVHASIVKFSSLVRPLVATKPVLPIAGKFFAVALAGVALWLAWSTG